MTLASMKAEIDLLREEVRASTKATQDLVSAWNAATTFVKFVKWIASFVAALSIIYLAVRHGLGLKGE